MHEPFILLAHTYLATYLLNTTEQILLFMKWFLKPRSQSVLQEDKKSWHKWGKTITAKTINAIKAIINVTEQHGLQDSSTTTLRKK